MAERLTKENTVADSNDAFQKLEEKLLRLLELFRRTQEEKRALKEEIDTLKANSKDGAKRFEALERELQVLRRERQDVRVRVERILQQIDILTKTDAGG